MTAPNSSAAPGHDVGAESAQIARLMDLRVLDLRLANASRVVGGIALLLVLTCACVLIALPDSMTLNCRAMQSEATHGLLRLRTVEESFRAEHDRYGVNAAELGFDVADARGYAFLVQPNGDASRPGFTAFAVGVGPMAGDLWSVDERGELKNPRNLCQF